MKKTKKKECGTCEGTGIAKCFSLYPEFLEWKEKCYCLKDKEGKIK